MHVNNPLLARPEPPHERAGLSTSAPERSTFKALLGRSRSRDGWRCSCHPGSATRGVQIGFATCLVLFILGYAALAGPGWAPLSSQRTTPGGASLPCMLIQCSAYMLILLHEAVSSYGGGGCAELALESTPCSYGSLPGFWTPVANNTVGNWTVFEESCQIEVGSRPSSGCCSRPMHVRGCSPDTACAGSRTW